MKMTMAQKVNNMENDIENIKARLRVLKNNFYINTINLLLVHS